MSSEFPVAEEEVQLLRQKLLKRNFWDLYKELRGLDVSASEKLKKLMMEILRQRVKRESGLSTETGNQIVWFLDPYWVEYLPEFPRVFPLSSSESKTYAPLVIDLVITKLGADQNEWAQTQRIHKLKSGIIPAKVVSDVTIGTTTSSMGTYEGDGSVYGDSPCPPLHDFFRRKVHPPFRCSMQEVEEEIESLIETKSEMHPIVCAALDGSALSMAVLEEGVVQAAYKQPQSEAFGRQMGFERDLVKLSGDTANLGERQRELLSLLNFSKVVDRLQLKKVAQGYGGGMVFFVTPSFKEEKLPSCVIKIGPSVEIAEEVDKTREFGRFFGNLTPTIKQMVELPDALPEELAAAAELDLAGGMFGLAGCTNAPSVLTFKSICEQRFARRPNTKRLWSYDLSDVSPMAGLPPAIIKHHFSGISKRDSNLEIERVLTQVDLEDYEDGNQEASLISRSPCSIANTPSSKRPDSLYGGRVGDPNDYYDYHRDQRVTDARERYHRASGRTSSCSSGSQRKHKSSKKIKKKTSLQVPSNTRNSVNRREKKGGIFGGAAVQGAHFSNDGTPSGGGGSFYSPKGSMRNEQYGGSAASHQYAESPTRDAAAAHHDDKRNNMTVQRTFSRGFKNGRVRYSKNRNKWVIARELSEKECPQGDGSDKEKDDDSATAHIDVQSILVEVLDRNLYSFTFNDLNGGTVRKLGIANLAKMYKLPRLVDKAVLDRHKFLGMDGSRATCLNLEELDPGGDIRARLIGEQSRGMPLKSFFQHVLAECEKRFSDMPIVTGRSHGDLHGENLLVDLHGLTWLIDFALAVRSGRHALFDITKLLTTTLLLYPYEYDELGCPMTNIGALFEVLAALPNNRCFIKESTYSSINEPQLRFAWEIASTVRSAAVRYEFDETHTSPFPWVIALLSWCLRVSTYREPQLPQLRACLYGAICMGVRILYADNIKSGPPWLSRAVNAYSQTGSSGTPEFEIEKIGWDCFKRELERYLVNVATRDAWLADPITRQQTKVMDMKVCCGPMDMDVLDLSKHERSDRKMTGKNAPTRATNARDALNLMLGLCLSTRIEAPSGRLLIVSESGMGKTLLTKQITSQAAQTQLIASAIPPGREKAHEDGKESSTPRKEGDLSNAERGKTPPRNGDDGNGRESWDDAADLHKHLICGGIIDDLRRLCGRMVPVRVPMIDFPNLYRRHPHIVNSHPQTDFLAQWTRMTYGANGIATRLICKAREASINYNIRHHQNHEQQEDQSECFLLIVFDGLDECGDFWAQGLQFITNFVKAEPRHAVVVTARPWEDRSLNVLIKEHDFSQFGINPLPTIQAEIFCRRKLQLMSMPEDATERIVRLICYSSEFKEMRTIPLILSLLLHLHKMLAGTTGGCPKTQKGTAEVSKTKIFRHVVHLMVYQVGANKVAHRDVLEQENLVEINRCRFLLRYAAWIAHRGRALTFAARDRNVSVTRMITQRSRTASVSWAELRVFAEQRGLLKPLQALMTSTISGHLPLVTGDKNQFRFARLVYEELLCGEFLACALMQDQTLTSVLFGQNLELLRDDAWVEPILHCMMTMNPSSMQQWLLEYILPRKDKSMKCAKKKQTHKRNNENTLVEDLLFTAVKFGARPVVDTLLQAQCSPEIRSKNGNTPLHYAARNGYTSVVDSLITFKACPKGFKAFNDNFRTPVQEAIFYGHVDVYRALTRDTRRGFPTDKALRDFPSSVPPHTPGDKSDFTTALSMETGIESTSDDVTSLHNAKGKLSPLMMAASEGSAKVVEAILEMVPHSTIDKRCPGPARATALCFAAENGRANVVKLLIEWKANVNIRYGPGDCSVLFWPAFSGYHEVVNLLLDARASPDGEISRTMSMSHILDLTQKKFGSREFEKRMSSTFGKRSTIETCHNNTNQSSSIDDQKTQSTTNSMDIHKILSIGSGGFRTGAIGGNSSNALKMCTNTHKDRGDRERYHGLSTKSLTPIHVAAATGQTHVVSLLMRYNASIDVIYKPLMLHPIHFAAFYGSDSVYRLLRLHSEEQDEALIKKPRSREIINAEEVRHLYECPPESMIKRMKVLSMKMEKLL